jgi:type III restriction enzyme
MENPFFEQPILNSPYEYLEKHWELVEGQATQKIVENRRRADLIAEAAATAKKEAIA